MKRIYLIIFMLLILCLSGCNNNDSVERNNKDKTKLSPTDKLVQYILEKTEHTTESLQVFPITNSNDNQEFLVTTPTTSGPVINYYVKFDGEKVLENKGIQDTIPNFKEVNLSQGTYLEVTQRNNDGKGSIVLWNQDNGEIAYEFSKDTFDYHYEGKLSKEMVNKYGLPKIKNQEGEGYSYVILSDIGLESYYSDINEDGYDDVTFFGRKAIVTGNKDNNKIIKSFIIKDRYIYDIEKEEFIYSEKLSEERED